jgi:REP element-mobilizing transposase RayT
MSTYTQLVYQIVFSTKYRRPVLEKEKRDDLFNYIWGILKNNNCHLYRINGVSYREELINLLNEHMIEFDERYLN